ncbi:MAG: sigma-54 dependent transcriptional regulator [Proteobacteria bacterium]|nr:sigma-54 dependent transcriptional regulator [Pseudomonadota bacterium]
MDRFSHRESSSLESPERRSASVLLVDDEAPLRRAFERYLRRAGHTVRCAATVEEGRSALSETEVDVAIVDFRLPDGSGADLIRWAVSNNRAQSVYCMTGNASGRAATEVLEAGGIEVLEKPIDVDRLAELIPTQDLVEASDTHYLNEDLESWRTCYARDIVGDDERLVEALETVRNITDTDCTVLLTGESGTGKEMVARALHGSSTRATGPFVALNCAAIPDTMVEAELFGHVRGAFTGAHHSRGGRVVAASGGTLFLDEIGDMPLQAQAKLLRVLQDRTIMPVGADMPVSIDIRVVAATNQDLEAMIAASRFRADLYYRLSVIPIELPPLRERGDDVIKLARVLLGEANARNQRQVTGIDKSAERALLSFDWPGNVRELAHLIERTVLLKGSGVITASDLRLRSTGALPRGQRPFKSTVNLDLRSTIDQVERQLIDEALDRTGGNRTEAASLLGVNRTTLVEKIRKHNASL